MPRLEFVSEQFDKQKEVLLSVSVDTEQEFIAFGREAGGLSADVELILAEVHKVLETAAGKDTEAAVGFFDRMVEDAGHLIAVIDGEIQGLIDELCAVRSQIMSLHDHRGVIDKSVSLPLSLLKMGFCIEGAHREQELSKVLESVALDISVLSKKFVRCTDEQFSGLEAATRSMEMLMGTLAGMSTDARRQHGEAGEQIDALRFQAEQLRRARCSQGEIAQKISSNGVNLHRRFNRVVMALQYHDITRQQMEHIAQAFDTMREWLPSAAKTGVCAVSDVTCLYQAAGVQIQQTRVALKSLNTAGREFREGMESISEGANELAEHVSIFEDLCRNDKVVRAAEGLLSLGTFINSLAAIKREVGEAACAIHGAVNDCTSAIHELTIDLRILAINAQVQAAGAGQQGVIKVLANNIYDVSSVIQKAADDFTKDIHIIMERLSDLATRAWKLGTKQTVESRAVAEGMPQCVEMLKEIEQKVASGLQNVSTQQGELGRRISLLLPRVHFPELASRRLETVLRFFEEIQAETFSTANGAERSPDALTSFEAHYTMASERNVHAMAVDRSRLVAVGAKESAVSLELFHETPSSDQDAPSKEFGDDIELF